MELDAAIADLEAATASVVEALRHTDVASVGRDRLLSVIEVGQRVSNTLAGVQTVAVAHVAAIEDVCDADGVWGEQHRGLGHEALDAPAIVGPVLGITAQAASTRCEVAVHQVATTPQLVTAMLAGELDAWRARVVTSEVEVCPDEGAHVIVEAVVAHYDDRGGWDETTGPLRARVRRLVARAHPQVVAEQAQAAREGRSVRRSTATLGTDHWEADLAVEQSAPMWQAVDILARRLRRANPDLTLDQARADALAQLVLARADVTIQLHATIPAPSSAGPMPPSPLGASGGTCTTPGPASGTDTASDTAASDERQPEAQQPAAPSTAESRLTEVGGLGSTVPTLVDLDVLAATVSVVPSTSLMCDPATGAVIGGVVPASLAKRARKDAARHHDGYVVPPDLARLVRLRDGRCRFPGCSTNAMFTDQDHVIAWPVGATTPTNLMCLCRRHHRIKQRHGWRVHLDPDGTVHWTDPTGRHTTTHPIDHLDRATVPLGSQAPTRPSTPIGSSTPPWPQTPRPQTPEPEMPHVPVQPRDADADVGDCPSRLRLLDLDEVPTLLEDHLRRQLELLDRDGPPQPLTVQWAPATPSLPPF